MFEEKEDDPGILNQQQGRVYPKKQYIKKKYSGQKPEPFEKVDLYLGKTPHWHQKQYMKYILRVLDSETNGLIQSPTGTGKTLALLTSIFGWLYQGNKRKKTVNKVIYLAKTHDQMAQIKTQLQKSCYMPSMVFIASRKQLCGLDQKDMPNINEICHEKRKDHQKYLLLKDKDILTQDQLQTLRGNKCKYDFAGKVNLIRFDKVYRNLRLKTISLADQRKGCLSYSQEDFSSHCCPYYYAKVKSKNETEGQYKQPDFLIMPYQYLLDKSIYEHYEDSIKDSIIIFDEGHNILKTACDGMSICLTKQKFQNAIKQLIDTQNILQKYYASKKKTKRVLEIDRENIDFIADNEDYASHDNEVQKIEDLLNRMKELREKINAYQQNFQKYLENKHQNRKQHRQFLKLQLLFLLKSLENQKFEFQGQKYEYFQIIKALQSNNQTLTRSLTTKIDIYLKKQLQKLQKLNVEIFEIKHIISQDFSLSNMSWLVGLSHIFYFLSDMMQNFQHFGIYIDKAKQVQFQCYKSSLMFELLASKQPRSIIITSGTLSPLSNWSHYTGLQFKQGVLSLNHRHLIKNSFQTRTLNINTHKDKKINFRNTKDNAIRFKQKIKESVQILQMIEKQVPGGVLVFLKSEQWRNQLYKQCVNVGGWKKKLFNEKDQKKNISNFKFKLLNQCQQDGFILFMAFRSTLGEGIDYPEELSRAVVVLGVPLRDYSDIQLQKTIQYHDQQKKEHSEEAEYQTGNQWSNQEVYRTINQGIGRIIRNQDDYGIIYLVEQMFQAKQDSKQKYLEENKFMNLKQNLSRWAQTDYKSIPSSQIASHTKQFFKANKNSEKSK